jgi:hypothetical protein
MKNTISNQSQITLNEELGDKDNITKQQSIKECKKE